jgi:chemotaxis response regulator CheB
VEVLVDKRVRIVDDCALIRGLICEFIELRPGIGVCGKASDSFEKGLELKPDAIIVDFSMPRMNGLQVSSDAPSHGARHTVNIVHRAVGG